MIVNFVQLLTDLGELFDEKSHYNLENKELKIIEIIFTLAKTNKM